MKNVIGIFLFCAATSASAQTVTPDLKDVAAACSGLEGIMASGGNGHVTQNGFDFDVKNGSTLTITRSGRTLSKVDNFSYDAYSKCLSDLVSALTKPPNQTACRIPSNGVEQFTNKMDEVQVSGWRGGGYSQQAWCADALKQLRAEHPSIGSTFDIIGQSEDSESKCRPFNCPQYNYTCKIHVETDPIYKLAPSPECPH